MNKLSRRLSAAVVLAAWCAPAVADEPDPARFELDDLYALGIKAHELDPDTQVIGWRLSPSWYIGQRDEKHAENGLSLVWHGKRRQVSVSLEEIRFVTRF